MRTVIDFWKERLIMLMPSIFANDLMDGFFDAPERNYKKSYYNSGLMKTDIKENKDGFEVIMDLPGFKKEDVKIQLKNGYLNIQATREEKKDEKDDKGKYVRRERYTGTCNRSFYVGSSIKHEDIHAKYEDGILKLSVPKKAPKAVEEKDGYIAIEG